MIEEGSSSLEPSLFDASVEAAVVDGGDDVEADIDGHSEIEECVAIEDETVLDTTTIDAEAARQKQPAS